jgi:hypothetical protein
MPVGTAVLSRTSVPTAAHCSIRAWLTAAIRAADSHAGPGGPPCINVLAAARAARSAASRARWLASTALASRSPETVAVKITAITPSMTMVADPRSPRRRLSD